MPVRSSPVSREAAAPEVPPRLCSLVSEASGEDPIGSAWSVPRYLLVELPLPWEYDLLAGRRVPAGLRGLVAERAGGDGGWGLIGIAPDDDYSVPGALRVIDFRLPPAPFRGYARSEYLFAPKSLVPSLGTLLDDPEAPALAPHRLPASAVRDLLVCTHGAVDACCAKFGYPIYRRLRQVAAAASAPVRVWRCTHFGGHRFAATLLDLPEGRYWGRLTMEHLSPLVLRDAPVATLRGCYRGWAALPHPLQQVAEGEAFARAGWAWTECMVTPGEPPKEDAAGAPVTFVYAHAMRGEAGAIAIDVRQSGTVETQLASANPQRTDVPRYRATVLGVTPADGLFGAPASRR